MDEKPHDAEPSDRGRRAENPTEIPKPGWWDILVRLRRELSDDDIGLTAAGVAFYGLLAVFPALTVVVTSHALWGDSAQLIEQIQGLRVVPPEARELLVDRLGEIARADRQAGWSLVSALLVGLWSASKGAKALVRAMNVVYDEPEDRGFLARSFVSLALTSTALGLGLLGLTVVLGVPALLTFVGLDSFQQLAVLVLPWFALAFGLMTALAIVYRLAPNRRAPRWAWVTPGAILSTLLWIIGSIGFSLYVSWFGRYDEVYGSLGAVVILLMWIYLTAYVVILGAEINAEIEHQTARDSTVGRDRPMGERGAFVADHLGRSRSRSDAED